MKLTLIIDQKASLLAGQDAPNDRVTYEFPVAKMSEETRQFLVPFYSPKNAHFWIDGWEHHPTAVMPLTDETVALALDAFAAGIQADRGTRAAEIAAEKAKRETERKEKLAVEEAAIDKF